MKSVSRYGRGTYDYVILEKCCIAQNQWEYAPQGAYYLQSTFEVFIAVKDIGYGVFNAYDIGRSSAKFDSDNMIRAEEQLPLPVIPIDLYQYQTYVLFKFTPLPATKWTNPVQKEEKWKHNILKTLTAYGNHS
jgi:hypothetical protein